MWYIQMINELQTLLLSSDSLLGWWGNLFSQYPIISLITCFNYSKVNFFRLYFLRIFLKALFNFLWSTHATATKLQSYARSRELRRTQNGDQNITNCCSHLRRAKKLCCCKYLMLISAICSFKKSSIKMNPHTISYITAVF